MTAVSNLALNILKPGSPVAPPGVAPGAEAFLALLTPAPVSSEDALPARQEDAASGKDLPDAPADLAWIAPPLIVLPVVTPAAPEPTAAPPSVPDAPTPKAIVPSVRIGEAPTAIDTSEPIATASSRSVGPMPSIPTDETPKTADTATSSLPVSAEMPRNLVPAAEAAPAKVLRRLDATVPVTPRATSLAAVSADVAPIATRLPVALTQAVTPTSISAPPLPAAPTAQPTAVIVPQAADAPVEPVASAAPLLFVTSAPRPAESTPPAPSFQITDAQPVRASAGASEPQRPVAAPSTAATPPAPTLAEPQIARIAPAAQVFAAAIQRATADERAATAPQPATMSAGVETLQAVTATADARHAALDMRQDNWPHQMIQRIEALRDAADVNDTRIRLIPDALGTIDVSVKREGDGVSVRLDAHRAETRQILAEAQPRLTELAESRGLRLSAASGTPTDPGGQPLAQQQQQQRPQQSTNNPSAPPRATAEADDTADADDRIA